MNRKFVVIISVATALLIALLIAISVFRSSPQSSDQTPEQIVAPTGIPNRNRVDDIPSLSKEKQDALLAIQNKLPFNSDSLSIDYSALTNKVYLQKKNENADAELQRFLESNQLLDLYLNNSELFVVTQATLQSHIDKEEQKDTYQFDEEDVDVAVVVDDPNTSGSTEVVKVKKQLASLNSIAMLFMTTQKIKTVPATSQSTPQTVPSIKIGGDTTSVPCAAGTDYGPADGYTNGSLTKIRVCRVRGTVVNSQVSKQYDDMIAAAATAGISLSAGSFRTMAGQIGIYQSWCKRDGIAGSPPPYPKAPGQTIKCPGGGAPGYSNHQMGLALDLKCNGSLIPRKYADASKNSCFKWLQANASKYGFYEYGLGKTRDGSTGYEGWHWSVNGN